MKHIGKAEVSVDSVEEWGKSFESLWEQVGGCFFRRLAQKMLEHAFDSGFSPEWVLANEVYGSDSKFRRLLLAIAWPRMSDVGKALLWPYWRREHQAVARMCHYRKRGNFNPLL